LKKDSGNQTRVHAKNIFLIVSIYLQSDSILKKLKNIYLHVGGDKTGSTTIQHVFDANRARLAEAGYYYAKNDSHYHLAGIFSQRPMLLDCYRHESQNDEDSIKEQAREYVDDLTSDLRSGNYHTLILSYEGFLGLNQEEMYSLKHFLLEWSESISVIYYMRPHFSYATSAMSERVRRGSPAWDVHPPITKYMPRLKILKKVFGLSTLSLRRFSRSDLLGGDVIQDFIALIQMPKTLVESLDIAVSKANKSLSEEAILIGSGMAHLLEPVSGPVGADFYEIFCPVLEKIKGRSYRLSKLQIEVIKRATEEDIRGVSQEFGIDLGVDEPAPRISQALSTQEVESRARLLLEQVLPGQKLPSEFPVQQAEASVVRSAKGRVTVDIEAGFNLGSDGVYDLIVIVENNSIYWWGGNVAPVKLCYHWFDQEGDAVIFDGIRTELPNEGIGPGEKVKLKMRIKVPDCSGTYKLQLTLIQEFFKWFEKIGLDACWLSVDYFEGRDLSYKLL
jgi:hypothetical protein